MIDNYDSFTFNLVQYFSDFGIEVRVYRNDEISAREVLQLQPDYIVISPGPCTPHEAGISNELITLCAGKIPLLGVCLGHQCLAQVFGAKIIRAAAPVHGKTAAINHDGSGIFKQLPTPVTMTRYHSLIVDWQTLPECLQVNAWCYDGEQRVIMGLKHKQLPLESVQFHPESFLSEQGGKLLHNFVTIYGKNNSKHNLNEEVVYE